MNIVIRDPKSKTLIYFLFHQKFRMNPGLRKKNYLKEFLSIGHAFKPFYLDQACPTRGLKKSQTYTATKNCSDITKKTIFLTRY